MTNGATNGYVLQSDASGNGIWTAPSAGSSVVSAGTGLSYSGSTLNSVWTASGTNIYSNNSGSVGIGTTNPSYKLDVQGTGSLTSNLQSSTSSAYFSATSLSTNESAMKFNTYVSSSSAPSRWIIGKGSGSETGSNAGSDFFINRYTDAGLYKGQPLAINRSNGTVTVGNDGVSTSENTLKVNGSMAMKVAAISTSNNTTTLGGGDYMVVYNGTTTGNSIVLPTASSYAGRIYMIINHSISSISTSNFTTANSVTSTSVSAGNTIQLVSDGSNWHKIN